MNDKLQVDYLIVKTLTVVLIPLTVTAIMIPVPFESC